MARRIAPGTPTPIKPVQMDIPGIDLQIFYKIGDDKIKSATQNFELYATTTANAEAQKAYQKFKNNPIALANALSKLPEMFSDLPESIRNDLKTKLDNNAISLVQKAQANQERAIAKQNKALAHANATLNMTQLADDYFNVLRYITAPEGGKRPGDLAIYKAHRAELEALTKMTDENGNPIFSETQRNKMLMPKDAALAGFKQFINRPELDDLKQWDTAVFQNRDKFKADTGIDDDTYDAMETALTKRIKQLADDKVREVHGQAYYDQVNLITEPTELNIEKAKSYDFTDDKAIDKLVTAAKETTTGAYYDPEKKTSPNAFVQAYNTFSELMENTDDTPSPEGQAKLVGAAAEAMTQLAAVAKETNLNPEYADRIKASIQKALTDKQAKQVLVDADFANRTRAQSLVLSATQTPFFAKTPTEALKKGQEQKGEYSRSALYRSAIQKATELADKRYNDDVALASMYYLAGDYDTFMKASAQADRNYDMNRASFIVRSANEWQRLQNDLASGVPALINYMGRTLEFKGFNNKGAVFVERN